MPFQYRKPAQGVALTLTLFALALVATVHGTALLLLGERVDAAIEMEFKNACLDACEVLIECGGKRVGGGAKGNVNELPLLPNRVGG